ncbi:hypothetical protein F2P81_020323 [Scophthalmus maximus]|uniref:Cilia- and flagella-associated protein 43 n=1 Tax=Scophthalmus maximus TaxID=52904 RepID=A0A6A4S902_SCOMX|nr:hypothetical protein F2P81_020323 [Scophthalmus maximus]
MCRWRDHSPTVTVGHHANGGSALGDGEGGTVQRALWRNHFIRKLLPVWGCKLNQPIEWWIQGFTNKTVEFVDNETVCYACGNHICFLRLDTKLQSVLQGPGRAIGALTASGKSGIFAFSEQKLSPSIFVYVYPELQLKNELKGTAQLDYTSLTLSDGGPYLGCCSSLPDHTITVCVIELPATDGSFAERLGPTSYPVRAKPPYFGPELPPVFTQTKLSTKARLTPSTICWTSTSKLLVGCAEGFLLLIDPVSRSVSVLFNPTTPDADPDLRQSSFQALTLNKNSLITVGKDSVVHSLQINGTQINITHTWQLEGPATTAMYSPDCETVLLSSNTGQIYVLNPTRTNKIVKVLDVLCGKFAAAAWARTDKNICVSVRDSGELQLWSVDGMRLGSVSLQAEVTSLACCPIAQYAAVGTTSGNVLFVDLSREQEPRLVHQVHLCNTPVDHLVQDTAGLGSQQVVRLNPEQEERYTELQCHPCRLGGVRSLTFSTDSLTLLTAGCEDGSLVCTNLRIKGVEAEMNKVTQNGQPMAHFLKDIFNTENPVLTDLPQWSQESCVGSENPEESEVMKEENEKCTETKENLRKTIQELRGTIQEMLRENENVPAAERLAQHELNLDVEGQKGLDAMVEQEATRVREEIEWEILAKRFLRDVLKRQCWDSLKVKSRSVKGFHCEHEVKNYPLKERTEKEVEELHRVQNMRKIEMAAITQCGLKKTSSAREEEQEEEDLTAESGVVTGSFSAQLGYSNPYIYDQFIVRTTEQKVNQIILLQDVIHRIKTAFNAEFDAVHRQKVQELNHVRERNRHIREILLELDMRQELWEPSLTNSEWPERLFTVDDSEIKAEKYLSPEQREEEERKELEEQKHLAAKEITQPEFALTKPDSHWSEEEKKVYKLYEKKTKDLSEKKEKYKKLRETEMKRLQVSTKDATKGFDETLTKLFEKKVKCEMTIYQEKLKITYLVYSVILEEEMRNQELDLKLKLGKTLAYRDEREEEVKRHEEEVELFLETYDTIVAEDKLLDKEFRKEFFDVPANVVDHLYKLFKRRPRVQKLRTDNKLNLFKEQSLWGSLAPDATDKMSKAMEEQDAPENTPEGLNPSVWKRFCLVRRVKIESEHKVNINSLTLAEMQKSIQERRAEKEAAQQEINNLSDELESLHKEKNRFLMDIMVQVIVKQGQVYTTDETADFPEYVLLHKGVVEDLNKTIRMLGGQNIASMVQRKDFRKNTFLLEWKHKIMTMQIEDLNNKARDIQRLHLSEERQDYLNKRDLNSRVSQQVSVLEKTIAFQEKAHLHNVQRYKNKIKELKKQAAMKAEKNAVSEQQLPNMQVTVAERRHIDEAIASEENQAATEGRHREIVLRKNLEDFARAQAEDLVVLWAELERLRMKNFPSLDQLKHY